MSFGASSRKRLWWLKLDATTTNDCQHYITEMSMLFFFPLTFLEWNYICYSVFCHQHIRKFSSFYKLTQDFPGKMGGGEEGGGRKKRKYIQVFLLKQYICISQYCQPIIVRNIQICKVQEGKKNKKPNGTPSDTLPSKGSLYKGSYCSLHSSFHSVTSGCASWAQIWTSATSVTQWLHDSQKDNIKYHKTYAVSSKNFSKSKELFPFSKIKHQYFYCHTGKVRWAHGYTHQFCPHPFISRNTSPSPFEFCCLHKEKVLSLFAFLCSTLCPFNSSQKCYDFIVHFLLTIKIVSLEFFHIFFSCFLASLFHLPLPFCTCLETVASLQIIFERATLIPSHPMPWIITLNWFSILFCPSLLPFSFICQISANTSIAFGRLFLFK